MNEREKKLGITSGDFYVGQDLQVVARGKSTVTVSFPHGPTFKTVTLEVVASSEPEDFPPVPTAEPGRVAR